MVTIKRASGTGTYHGPAGSMPVAAPSIRDCSHAWVRPGWTSNRVAGWAAGSSPFNSSGTAVPLNDAPGIVGPIGPSYSSLMAVITSGVGRSFNHLGHLCKPCKLPDSPHLITERRDQRPEMVERISITRSSCPSSSCSPIPPSIGSIITIAASRKDRSVDSPSTVIETCTSRRSPVRSRRRLTNPLRSMMSTTLLMVWLVRDRSAAS